jgi:hypothetical protein
MDAAVRGGHLRVAEWLLESCSKGCSRYATVWAAGNGDLPMLQWLHQHCNDRFDTDVMDNAAREGHLETVKWLHEHRPEGCTEYTMDTAAANGHLEVVRWLHEHRTEGCTTDAMDGAAENGHLDVVKWSYGNRSEGCTDEAMSGAAQNGHVDVLQWLVEHYPDKCRVDLMEDAGWEDDSDVAEDVAENTNQQDSEGGLASQESLQTLLLLMPDSYREGGNMEAVRSPVVGAAFDKILAQLSDRRASSVSSLWGEALESLEIFHSSGFFSHVSLMLEKALKRGFPTLVQQFVGRRDADEKRKYVTLTARLGDDVLLRWLLANGASIDPSFSHELATAYAEVSVYLSEGDRVQLVREVVTELWGPMLLLWMLENTTFNDVRSRIAIGNAMKQAPSDTVQWLRDNLTSAEVRKWCFSSHKRQRVR